MVGGAFFKLVYITVSSWYGHSKSFGCNSNIAGCQEHHEGKHGEPGSLTTGGTCNFEMNKLKKSTMGRPID